VTPEEMLLAGKAQAWRAAAEWHEGEESYIRANAKDWPVSIMKAAEIMRADLHRESAAHFRKLAESK
jgi:hypothetical protein